MAIRWPFRARPVKSSAETPEQMADLTPIVDRLRELRSERDRVEAQAPGSPHARQLAAQAIAVEEHLRTLFRECSQLGMAVPVIPADERP